MVRIKRILSIFLILALTFSCASLAEEGSSVFTRDMVERSLRGVGNTQRLHNVIDKARRGEEITLVYLGGSITEGALAVPQSSRCYAALSARQFAEKYMPDPSRMNYVNAGISGTPSLLGITRLEQDVLVHSPDVVFVEFAVNDSADPVSQMVYESLIRRLLQSDSQPAVVLIFTLMREGHTCQPHMLQVGKHYDLGMISVVDAVKVQIILGKMQWSDYSSDYTHPNNDGHAFIADLISHYFDQAAAVKPTPYTLPEEAVFGMDLQHLKNVRNGDAALVSTGDFPFGLVTCYSYKQGWKHTSGAEPLTLRLTASYLTLAFRQENNQACGTAEVLVDGVVKATLPGHAGNAWGNVVTQLIDLGGSGEHTIEIHMSPGSEDKRFNLLDIAYAP